MKTRLAPSSGATNKDIAFDTGFALVVGLIAAAVIAVATLKEDKSSSGQKLGGRGITPLKLSEPGRRRVAVVLLAWSALLAYALMTLLLGPGTVSGFSGSLALSVLMIPVVVRSTEELLKIVPNELREASYALGVPKWRTSADAVTSPTPGTPGTLSILSPVRACISARSICRSGEKLPALACSAIASCIRCSP